MSVKQLSDGGTAGVCLGQSSTDKVGFYGATPVVRPTSIADATDTTSAISRVNAVITALESLGLITTV